MKKIKPVVEVFSIFIFSCYNKITTIKIYSFKIHLKFLI